MSDDWLNLIRDPNPWRPPDPLPEPVRTPRLLVRLYEKGDGPLVFEAIDACRESLLPWMVWARTDHLDEADSTYFVERSRRAASRPDCTDFPMGIFDPDGMRLLGGTGLHRIRPELREAEVGYWVREDEQGKGLCTEAAGALISAVLTPSQQGGWGFRRVVVINAIENVASRRVCEKLGLRLEMRLRLDRYLGPPGDHGAPGYLSTLGFGVLESEWDFENHRAKSGIAWEDGSF